MQELCPSVGCCISANSIWLMLMSWLPWSSPAESSVFFCSWYCYIYLPLFPEWIMSVCWHRLLHHIQMPDFTIAWTCMLLMKSPQCSSIIPFLFKYVLDWHYTWPGYILMWKIQMINFKSADEGTSICPTFLPLEVWTDTVQHIRLTYHPHLHLTLS